MPVNKPSIYQAAFPHTLSSLFHSSTSNHSILHSAFYIPQTPKLPTLFLLNPRPSQNLSSPLNRKDESRSVINTLSPLPFLLPKEARDPFLSSFRHVERHS